MHVIYTFLCSHFMILHIHENIKIWKLYKLKAEKNIFLPISSCPGSICSCHTESWLAGSVYNQFDLDLLSSTAELSSKMSSLDMSTEQLFGGWVFLKWDTTYQYSILADGRSNDHFASSLTCLFLGDLIRTGVRV